ncbi:MAG: hypothetical protein JNM25_18655 [Planctomycetes bacterium]|nr:hypothetical protein [Planctomycetota bacterium]
MHADAAADEADDADPEAEEQDLLVVLRLSNRRMGVHSERQAIETFADELEQVVTEAGVGEYDGDEIGGGECVLFFCGPDIDALLAVLQPHLKRSPLCRGGHLVRMVASADGTPERQRIPL